MEQDRARGGVPSASRAGSSSGKADGAGSAHTTPGLRPQERRMENGAEMENWIPLSLAEPSPATAELPLGSGKPLPWAGDRAWSRDSPHCVVSITPQMKVKPDIRSQNPLREEIWGGKGNPPLGPKEAPWCPVLTPETKAQRPPCSQCLDQLHFRARLQIEAP